MLVLTVNAGIFFIVVANRCKRNLSFSQKEAPSTRNRTADLPMVAVRASRLNHWATQDRRLSLSMYGGLHTTPAAFDPLTHVDLLGQPSDGFVL